ncbi:MAG: hypothetical protein ABT00_19600 [Bordetella sp. SCN 68-11]|nr:MAG: hypothetical protein ABT00_19600 [Bordetella sp. SCN 68-11]
MMRASSSSRSSISRWTLRSTSARARGGVSRHAGRAAAAASTAARASSRPASATWATDSPVAGSETVNERGWAGLAQLPSM